MFDIKISKLFLVDKRGITPLIATVLIIGLTVALAAIVIVWGSRFVEERIGDVDEEGSLEALAGEIDMKLLSAEYNEGIVTIKVENSGKQQIESLIVRGGADVEAFDLSGAPLKQFEIETYTILDNSIFSGNTVEVIPGADLDNDGEVEYFGSKSDDAIVEYSYFRIFVSTDGYDGNLGGLDGADALCQGLADTPGIDLNGKWKAWLSTEFISASDRLYHSSVLYQLLDGNIVANDWNDLTDGDLIIPIDLMENQVPDTGNFVITGTDGNGNSKKPTGLGINGWCSSWSAADTTRFIDGFNPFTDGRWTDKGSEFCDGSSTPPGILLKLYCFEQGLGF